MRVIHSARKSRLRCRRSRYAYCPAFITACFATRKTFFRRPRNPLACAMTFLCLACAVTPRFTLGMAVSSAIGKHHAHRAAVRLVHLRGAAQVALPLGRLLREDVAQERSAALDATAALDLEALRSALFRLQLGHVDPF